MDGVDHGAAMEKYWGPNRGFGAMASAYNGGLGFHSSPDSLSTTRYSNPQFILLTLLSPQWGRLKRIREIAPKDIPREITP